MSELVQRLERMVGVPTSHPVGDERRLAALIADELRGARPDVVEIGETPRPDGPPSAWVFARWGHPRVVLNAHIDTVPPGPGWDGDPLVLRRDGDRLIGLGAADVKGSAAAIVEAVHRKRPTNLAVLLSGDEEHGNTAIRSFLDSQHCHGVETVVVCEPTGSRVGTRHRGILALELSLEGPGGHSSRADVVPSPVADLSRVAVALSDWGRERAQMGPEGFEGMCLNLGRFDGGVAFNVIPASASLSLSARPAPGMDVAAIRDELVSLVRGQASGVRIDVVVEHPPFASRDPEAFVPLLGDVATRPIDLSFWTEAALLSRAGMNAVVFGPGHIEQAHAANEWVSLAALEAAVDTFTRLIDATAGDPHGHR